MNKKDFIERIIIFSKRIVVLVDILDSRIATKEIAKQLIRSGTSISANVIEAQGASTKKDYINFYHYSLKSANETIFWLKLLKDVRNIPNSNIELMLNEAKEIANMLASSIITMKNN